MDYKKRLGRPCSHSIIKDDVLGKVELLVSEFVGPYIGERLLDWAISCGLEFLVGTEKDRDTQAAFEDAASEALADVWDESVAQPHSESSRVLAEHMSTWLTEPSVADMMFRAANGRRKADSKGVVKLIEHSGFDVSWTPFDMEDFVAAFIPRLGEVVDQEIRSQGLSETAVIDKLNELLDRIEPRESAIRAAISEADGPDRRDALKASEPAPEEPEAPSMGRCVAGDTTVEALVSILEDNPRGLLVHRDELAGWVRSMDQYKGGKGSDRQNWLNLWNTDEVIVDRKSRMGEPIILAKPFVSLFGGVQPAMLGELGGTVEDGLMDRFLFAYPAPRHIRFTDDEVSGETEARYTALYEKLANLTLASDEHGDPNPKPLKLTREARKLFAGNVDALGAEMLQPGFPSRLEGVWSKLRGYLARLSLVLAVCRCVEAGIQEERVEREDIEAASQLLGYFKAHARRVYAEVGSPDPLEVLGGDLKALIEESGGQLEATVTELYRRLEDMGCEALPTRPKELGGAIRSLANRSSALRASFGWRGKEKVARLEILSELVENSVGTVGSVGKDGTSTNPTNATNVRFAGEERTDPAPTNATDARIEDTASGERSRFAI